MNLVLEWVNGGDWRLGLFPRGRALGQLSSMVGFKKKIKKKLTWS